MFEQIQYVLSTSGGLMFSRTQFSTLSLFIFAFPCMYADSKSWLLHCFKKMKYSRYELGVEKTKDYIMKLIPRKILTNKKNPYVFSDFKTLGDWG